MEHSGKKELFAWHTVIDRHSSGAEHFVFWVREMRRVFEKYRQAIAVATDNALQDCDMRMSFALDWQQNGAVSNEHKLWVGKVQHGGPIFRAFVLFNDTVSLAAPDFAYGFRGQIGDGKHNRFLALAVGEQGRTQGSPLQGQQGMVQV